MKPDPRWYLKLLLSVQVIDIIGKPNLSFSPEIPAVSGLHVQVLQEQDISELMEFQDSRCIGRTVVFSHEEAHARLESGWRCFGARRLGCMAGFVWFAPRALSSPDLHCEFEMDARSVMITNAFVAPEHRGRNVFPILMNESFRTLTELGYKRVYGFVHHGNRSSKKALAKHHFQTLGMILSGFVMGVYFFLPFIADDAGICVRFCGSPWLRWREFFRKRAGRAIG
ncbi:MAG TPA: hypothetical protein PKO27_14305 [Deltaproteobacteria bacterium]|jgi:GNAT superfamily N-acetyltransferase|nr:hypothetical protein [Deltaproteobacteria bacterium]HRR70247.1 hypothetical protein [Desulfomonilia bacterium]HOE73764.1 hypothetical protein [Deltaproteobacteria bacterium]HPL87398.1 hypothetical protein [Deltaproteobacteria bacterium]HQQ13900.1 hypothetical protein [Deltaproteobacteria bacterium]